MFQKINFSSLILNSDSSVNKLDDCSRDSWNEITPLPIQHTSCLSYNKSSDNNNNNDKIIII
jgi:hypothetical protein